MHACAQFSFAQVGVNGLTCSQCLRSTEMALMKLDFVEKVEMELEKTEGKVFFKLDKKVEMDKVAQAVEDAGFSVRFLKAEFDFSTIKWEGDNCFRFENAWYQLQNFDKEKAYSGKHLLTFVGKNFQELKAWKAMQEPLQTNCGKKNDKLFSVLVE